MQQVAMQFVCYFGLFTMHCLR